MNVDQYRIDLDAVEDYCRSTPGATVAIVGETRDHARLGFHELAGRHPLDALVRKGVGAERIAWPNGASVIPLSLHAPAGWRGINLDRFVYPLLLTTVQAEFMAPSFATSPLPFGPDPDTTDDVVTLANLIDLLGDTVQALDGLDEQIATLRHATDDVGARVELAAAGGAVCNAWSHARVALTNLTELQAVQS